MATNASDQCVFGPPCQIFERELNFQISSLKEVGQRRISEVYEVEFRGRPVAVKKKVNDDVDPTTEVALTKHLCHPNILHIIGYGKVGLDESIIVMELAENGSLDNYLATLNKGLPTYLFFPWINQATAAVQYLHDLDIVHRAIKSSNFLIKADNTLKLGDFGLARAADNMQTASDRGSVPWMAPEIMKLNKFSKPSDIYALATVIWEMSTGEPPYKGLTAAQIQQKVLMKDERLTLKAIPKWVPTYLLHILRQCWCVDSLERPTITQIISQMAAEKSTIDKSILADMPTEKDKNEIGLSELQGAGARGIARVQYGQIAVVSREDPRVHVYDITTAHKLFSMEQEGQLREAIDVAVFNRQTFLVADKGGSVVEFDDGEFKRSFKAFERKTAKGRNLQCTCITTDKRDLIYVGGKQVISILSPDRKVIGSIPVTSTPHYVTACSSRDELAFTDGTGLKVIDLKKMKQVQSVGIPRVSGLCYSEDAQYLHVVERQQPFGPGGVRAYNVKSGRFKKTECQLDKLLRPGGITVVTPDLLAVADWNSVKILASNC